MASVSTSQPSIVSKLRGEAKDLTLRLPPENEQAKEINRVLEDWESTWTGLLKGLTEVSGTSFRLESEMVSAEADVDAQAEAIRTVATEASESADGLTAMASVVRGVAETARRTVEASVRGSEGMENLLVHLDSLQENQKKTATFLKGLVEASTVLQKILADIEDISDGLGILSINAAIESARAGTAGKGFAVIAKEVQKVAGRTTEASGRAAKLVRDLETQTSGVAQGLEEAKGTAEQGKRAGTQISEELSDTARQNSALEAEIARLQAELERRTAYAQTMKDAATRLDETKDSLRSRVHGTSQLAESLHETIEDILIHAGGVRVEWHLCCADGLKALAGQAEHKNKDWDTFLADCVQKTDLFSLLYTMDARGTQISANAVAPAYRGKISEGGKGENRKTKPYFAEAIKQPGPYISPIYLSSASQSLCLTVSVQLSTGEVLAGDVSLEDLVRLDACRD